MKNREDALIKGKKKSPNRPTAQNKTQFLKSQTIRKSRNRYFIPLTFHTFSHKPNRILQRTRKNLSIWAKLENIESRTRIRFLCAWPGSRAKTGVKPPDLPITLQKKNEEGKNKEEDPKTLDQTARILQPEDPNLLCWCVFVCVSIG